MPYLRITCPTMAPEQRRNIAWKLTDTIAALFSAPHADVREHTTVHFTMYGPDELFIGGRTPDERGSLDITVELSDWSMSVKQQRLVAKELTPVLAEGFGVPAAEIEGINIRFHSYPPTDFAVGGKLLADRVPLLGRAMKQVFG